MLVFWFFTFYCQLLEILIIIIFYNYFYYSHQYVLVCFSCSLSLSLILLLLLLLPLWTLPRPQNKQSQLCIEHFMNFRHMLGVCTSPIIHMILLYKVCISKHELNGPMFESQFCTIYLLFYLCKLLLENNLYYIRKFAYENACNFITQKY